MRNDHTLIVAVTGLRSGRGNVVLALFRGPEGFPDQDSRALAAQTLPLAGFTSPSARFERLDIGDYAVALFHDENANGRLDTFWGMPTEGLGVSNNPLIRWRAPSFREARFTIRDTDSVVTIKVEVRYLSHSRRR
jgi:uncharacterized protein (DUF2141 family)